MRKRLLWILAIVAAAALLSLPAGLLADSRQMMDWRIVTAPIDGGSSVSVGATSTTVAAENTARLGMTLVNDSDETIYVSFGQAAVMNKGVRLNASGGSYTMSQVNLYTGAIYAICTSGTKNLCVTQN